MHEDEHFENIKAEEEFAGTPVDESSACNCTADEIEHDPAAEAIEAECEPASAEPEAVENNSEQAAEAEVVDQTAEAEQHAAPAETPVAEIPDDIDTREATVSVAEIRPILEALLFAVEGQVTARKLASVIDGANTNLVREALEELRIEYITQQRGFRLEELAGGFQLLSHTDFAPYLEKMQKRQTQTKLSAAALETLAIIAYKQPIGRADIEAIRGVQAGPMLRMLIDRGMVRIAGREEVIGRPFLYGTTKKFLEHFGLKSLEHLPQAEQLQMPQ